MESMVLRLIYLAQDILILMIHSLRIQEELDLDLVKDMMLPKVMGRVQALETILIQIEVCFNRHLLIQWLAEMEKEVLEKVTQSQVLASIILIFMLQKKKPLE